MVRGYRLWASCLLLACMVACGEHDISASIAPGAVHREAERWGRQEQPNSLGQMVEYHLDHLPRQGRVRQMPWPGSHWPLVDDGLNARWDGPASMSAVEKYGQAMGLSDLEDRVSAYYGLDAYRGEEACRQDRQCPWNKPHCGKRRGASSGHCVGDWWGVCHAWSPASIAEAEPRHPVVYKGVEFKVNDIKALLTLAYLSNQSTQLGERSEINRFQVDRQGRAVSTAIRQVNPGTFHLMLANYVGLRQTSFTMDRDLTYRVFNHPVAAYRVKRLAPVDARTANQLLGMGARRYPYNEQAAALYDVAVEVSIVMDTQHHEDGALVPVIERYLQPRTYTYILEVDHRGMIVGGEWLGKNKLDHPDFLWAASSLVGTHRAGGAISVAVIQEIAEMSRK